MNFCKIAIVNYDRNWWAIIHFLFKFYKPVLRSLTGCFPPAGIPDNVCEFRFFRCCEWFPRFINSAFPSPVSALFSGNGLTDL